MLSPHAFQSEIITHEKNDKFGTRFLSPFYSILELLSHSLGFLLHLLLLFQLLLGNTDYCAKYIIIYIISQRLLSSIKF